MQPGSKPTALEPIISCLVIQLKKKSDVDTASRVFIAVLWSILKVINVDLHGPVGYYAYL